MQGAPQGLDVNLVAAEIQEDLGGSDSILKEIKIWELCRNKFIATIKADLSSVDPKVTRTRIRKKLAGFGVVDSTIENIFLN